MTAARLIRRSATRQVWELDADRYGTTAVFPTLNWPTWTQRFDSYNIAMDAQPGSGLMSTPLDADEQTVYITLGRTPIRLAAELLSVWGFLMITMLLVIGGRPSRATVARIALALAIVAASIALFRFLWRNDPADLPRGDLTWDFAQMAYLHHDPGGVAFEGGARLYEYGYSADEIAAGKTLTVTLSVAPGDRQPATLALVTPAGVRPPPQGAAEPPVLAAASRPLAAETLAFALPIPADAPPGLYVPRLTLEGARPLMPSGQTRGDLFLRPIRVTADGRPPTVVGEDDRRQTTDDGQTRDDQRLTTNAAIDVVATTLAMRDPTTLDGRFAWYTARPLGARYQFSWRLQDAAGGTLAQLDAQPGYGYQPSTLWPAGEWTADWLALRLPEAAPAEGDYPLVMRLYDVNTGETLLTRRVGILSWAGGAWQPRLHEPSFVLPERLAPMDVTFGSETYPFIALRGYQMEREAEALRLTLYWEALDDVRFEYTRFVHLLDAAGAIVAQADSAPAGDSYPTSQWAQGEIVSDTVTFDLSALPLGEYTLAAGLYRPTDNFPRLDAAGPDGPLPDARALLPETITVGQ